MMTNKEYVSPDIIIQPFTEDVITASWDSHQREDDETQIIWG